MTATEISLSKTAGATSPTKPTPSLADNNFSLAVRIAMTVVSLGTIVFYVTDVHSPIRSLVALAFFAAAPGVAIVRHMPSLHSNARWGFAVALSLTINSTVPLIAVWTHTYKPFPILLVVVWPTIFGLWKTRSTK